MVHVLAWMTSKNIWLVIVMVMYNEHMDFGNVYCCRISEV